MKRRRDRRETVPVDNVVEDRSADVAGPSPNPASNLIMADILIRAGSYVVRSAVEKGLLKGRYGKDTAREILRNRSAVQTFASFAAAKVASRSVPGAAIVGSGIAAKTLFDLSSKRRARLKGERALAKQARDED